MKKISKGKYGNIPMIAEIQDDMLKVRAFVKGISIENFKKFYKKMGIDVEQTEDYIETSISLEGRHRFQEEAYLKSRLETLFSFLVLTFDTRLHYNFDQVFLDSK